MRNVSVYKKFFTAAQFMNGLARQWPTSLQPASAGVSNAATAWQNRAAAAKTLLRRDNNRRLKPCSGEIITGG